MIIIILLCIILPTLEVYTPEFLAKLPSVDFCHADAKKCDVFYYLFKGINQTTAITLTEDYIFPEDDRTIPLKIFLHGYTSNITTYWYKDLKREYFKKGPHNVIYVDWSIAANKSFAVSAANIKPVGEYIADFVLNLKVPLDNIHLIGHSLGAHLAGFVGKFIYWKTENKIARITATDPAGPGFERVGSESRLSIYDARFIDVIHTDMGYYGIIKPLGHVDFYPNGGRHKQPGCPSRKTDDNCSHARSNILFKESVNNPHSLAKPAKLEQDEISVVSNKPSDKIVFGDATPVTAKGLYYFKTNNSAPFLLTKS